MRGANSVNAGTNNSAPKQGREDFRDTMIGPQVGVKDLKPYTSCVDAGLLVVGRRAGRAFLEHGDVQQALVLADSPAI